MKTVVLIFLLPLVALAQLTDNQRIGAFSIGATAAGNSGRLGNAFLESNAFYLKPENWKKLTVTQQQAVVHYGQLINSYIPHDPWRVMNSQTNSVKTDGIEFCGKVVDVCPDGVRIEGEYGKLLTTGYYPGVYDYRDFFVAHFSGEVVDGQIISSSEHFMAWSAGTYTYATVQGASRTIPKLDYGIPCGPPDWYIKQQEKAETDAEAAAEAAKEKAASAKQAAAERVLKANQDAAAKGDAYGLLRMGERYRDGDGVEKDLAKAKKYLQKAADAGLPTATEELSKLKE